MSEAKVCGVCERPLKKPGELGVERTFCFSLVTTDVECPRLGYYRERAAREKAEAQAEQWWNVLCASADALGLLVPETAPHLAGWAKKKSEELQQATFDLANVRIELASEKAERDRWERIADERQKSIASMLDVERGRLAALRRAADRLADEVAVLVRRGKLDSRSPAADALLDYRNPPSTPRADRLVVVEAQLAEACKELEATQQRGSETRPAWNAELERLREWKKQALEIVGSGFKGHYQGHPVADAIDRLETHLNSSIKSRNEDSVELHKRAFRIQELEASLKALGRAYDARFAECGKETARANRAERELADLRKHHSEYVEMLKSSSASELVQVRPNCEAPCGWLGGGGIAENTGPGAKYHCKECGEPVCGMCSAKVASAKRASDRICNNCQEGV